MVVNNATGKCIDNGLLLFYNEKNRIKKTALIASTVSFRNVERRCFHIFPLKNRIGDTLFGFSFQ